MTSYQKPQFARSELILPPKGFRYGDRLGSHVTEHRPWSEQVSWSLQLNVETAFSETHAIPFEFLVSGKHLEEF